MRRRPRLECYDLFHANAAVYVGWHVVHDGQRYTERYVEIENLETLPRTAQVRVENAKWRRP